MAERKKRNCDKSKKARYLLPILCVLLLVLVLAVLSGCTEDLSDSSEHEEETLKPTDGLRYLLINNDTAYAVISMDPSEETFIVIPSTYQGLPVVEIGKNVFQMSKEMTNIQIPDSITTIGEYAFSGCSKLESVTIPNSVTSIGERAFFDCTALTKITLPFVGDRKDNPKNTRLTYIFQTIPHSLKTVVITGGDHIGKEAFVGCVGVTNIVFGNRVKSIGEYAFSTCASLSEITIPDSVEKIGSHAFSKCTGLTNMTLPFVGGNKNGTGDTHFGYIFGAPSYSDNDQYVPSNLKSVTITSATKIDADAFYQCSGLETVTFSSGCQLSEIGSGAFRSCAQLKNITIPKSVTSMGNYVFYDCIALTNLTFADESNWYLTVSEADWKNRIDGTRANGADLTANRFQTLYQYYWYKK